MGIWWYKADLERFITISVTVNIKGGGFSQSMGRTSGMSTRSSLIYSDGKISPSFEAYCVYILF